VVTNLALEKYALYRNDVAGQFRYASLTTGLAALTAHSSGWGVGLFDFDNDGWKDLFVTQSHVLDNVEQIHSGLRNLEPPALFRNQAGKFEKSDLAGLPAVAGRGAAFGDLNNEGYVDVVVSVLGGRPLVLLNRGGANHWLTLKLVGVHSSRDGAGAKVKIGNQSARPGSETPGLCTKRGFMIRTIEKMLSSFERGQLTRRELALSLAALVTAQAAPKETELKAVSINHVTVIVPDLHRTSNFYQEFFGMPLKQQSAKTHILGVGDSFFGIEQGDNQTAAVDHYDFGIAGFDADQARAKLKKRNLKIGPGNSKESFKFYDPDGLQIQLNAPDYVGHVV
jgi:catechol 2,3-dioxygenase-like lactoylglutathione lyase family enzyme